MSEFNNNFQNYNTVNFDPTQVANLTSSVIQFIVVLDVSPSISDYVTEMNKATEELFMQEFKNSHRRDDIMLKCISFCEVVEDKSGFMPIVNLQDDYLKVHPKGRGTALYDAVLSSLEQTIKYREDLEDQGVDVRSCIFIITDGENNSSSSQAPNKIKSLLTSLRQKESWISSFNITMLGVGNPSMFQSSCIEMGLDHTKCLVTIQDTAKDMRKVIGVVSQSVSSSSAQTQVSF